MLNYKIIVLETDVMFPHEVDDTEELSFWFGEFYDEFLLQTNKSIAINSKGINKHVSLINNDMTNKK